AGHLDEGAVPRRHLVGHEAGLDAVETGSCHDHGRNLIGSVGVAIGPLSDPTGERAVSPVETTDAPTPEALAPEAPPSSKAWLGWLAGFVVVALLAGTTGVLFVRVQD